MNETSTRRSFLGRMFAATAAVGVAAANLPKRAWASTKEALTGSGAKELPRWGMAIDLDLCTACGACTVACRTENNVPMTGHAPGSEGTAIYWMDLIPKEHIDHNDPQMIEQILPVPCMHCDNPPCVKVCPVGATFQNEEGITAQVWDRCIGCRYCETACPYSRRYFNWSAPEWPEEHRNFLNPDVATRPSGVVEKCTFCHHRIRDLRETARLEEREITDADVQHLPACAQSCPTQAITFGNLKDPDSLVSRLSKSPRVSRLLEYLGTKPKVFYLAKDRRVGK